MIEKSVQYTWISVKSIVRLEIRWEAAPRDHLTLFGKIKKSLTRKISNSEVFKYRYFWRVPDHQKLHKSLENIITVYSWYQWDIRHGKHTLWLRHIMFSYPGCSARGSLTRLVLTFVSTNNAAVLDREGSGNRASWYFSTIFLVQ